MPEPTRPLPANRAFVIQLQAAAAESEMRHAGRVEHLTSGQAARFEGEDELWAFVDGVLLEVARGDGECRRPTQNPADTADPQKETWS